MEVSAKPQILLCTSKLADLAKPFEAELLPSIEDAARAIGVQRRGIFVLDTRLDPSLSFLESISKTPLIRMVIVPDLDFHLFQRCLNRGRAFRIARASDHPEVLKQRLSECIDEFHFISKQDDLIKRSSKQNRELEELSMNLESLVQDRTQGIQEAKEKEEERLLRIRRLVRFTKDLAMDSSVEDLLNHVRLEARPIHQVVSPILVYESAPSQFTVAFFDKSIYSTRIWEGSLRATGNSELVDPQFLIRDLPNLLGRPVAKVLPIILNLKMRPALLLIEHMARFKEAKSIESSFAELRRPLEMALDRLLLEMENNFYSFRWEKTFDTLNHPISIIDREMRVLRSNRKFSEKHRKGNCFQLFSGFEKKCEGCPVEKAVETGLPEKGLVQVGARMFQVQAYPIHLGEAGPTSNVVNFYIDVTAQRELQKRVLQSEKMSAVGILAGNVAHELNNPLTGIRSLAQILKTQVPAGSTQEADLKEIEKAAARCQSIIRNLLEFTISSEKKLQVTTMDEVVERTLPFMKSLVRNFRLRVHLSTREHAICVEPNLMQQVVFNLIHNASQAMETLFLEQKSKPESTVASKGTLSIRTSFQNGFVRLEIEDTGKGIPEPIQDRIFDPFFTTKAEGRGTGLGLSLSREIVEKFQGRIYFQSVVGQGTVFTVELPENSGAVKEVSEIEDKTSKQSGEKG